jgi:Fic family protein
LENKGMERGIQGRYVTISTVGEKTNAFVPFPLPPQPPIDWTSELHAKFDQALLALGRLDSVSTLLPDTSLFLYMYIRKEAILSSMIEGTQSSLSDLLLFELDQEPNVPMDDVREVSNYVAALERGLNLLNGGLPISLRLFREVHATLLKKGRGSNKTPGEFRRSQNWIGGTRPGNAAFVPPPPEEVMKCMGKLELFLHDQPVQTPLLLKAALAHAQFETIHPFLDGNGRLGRLLITLLLCGQSVLRQPMLYLSLYFNTHRQLYYELLNSTRYTGDWETWLDFFAEAVIATASQAVETAMFIHGQTNQDRSKISQGAISRGAASALLLHQAMMERPLATSSYLAKKTGLAPATVNKSLSHLEDLGSVKEITNRKRNRVFSYAAYIDIMSRGTELPD